MPTSVSPLHFFNTVMFSTWTDKGKSTIHRKENLKILLYWGEKNVSNRFLQINSNSSMMSSLHHLLSVFLFPSSFSTLSLRPSLWQKPLLLLSLSCSNTRTQERLFFLHCILMQRIVALTHCSFPVRSRATGSHRPPSTSSSGGHFGSLSVRDHYTLQLHMYFPTIIVTLSISRHQYKGSNTWITALQLLLLPNVSILFTSIAQIKQKNKTMAKSYIYVLLSTNSVVPFYNCKQAE